MLYRFGPFEVDSGRRLLFQNGQPLAITGKALDLLLFLLEERHRTVDKAELMDRVWPETAVEEGNLTQGISTVRKILGEKAGENRYIATVTGRGYQFVAPVEQGATLATAPVRDGISRRHVATLVALAVAGLGASFVATRLLPSYGPPTTILLTSLTGEETQPAFSPDGRQVAFVWAGESGRNQDIYVTVVGTGSTLRLTTDPANDSSPVWSPDGRYIAFHRDSTRPAYFSIPSIGGAERKVLEVEPGGKSIGRKAVWSPDGRALIVSARPERNAPRQLLMFSLDSREKRPLTSPRGPWGDEDPVFSPDGRWLAFVRGFVQLIVARADGSDERVLSTAPGIRGLAWTVDGKNIVYASFRSSGNNLWRIPLSGGAPEMIGGVSGGVAFPTFSPDGRKLVYSESRVNANVWALPAGTDLSQSAAEPFTKLIHSTRSQSSPQISPDGRRIVFVSDRSGSREIWICDSDGRNPRQLTSFGGPHVGTPRWSPDGASIVFDAIVSAAADIYVIASDGGALTNVTPHPSVDVTPSYSRDGRWIYFSSNRTGMSEIWRVPAPGGEAVQITRTGAAAPMQSYDGRFLYYSKFTEDPGLYRVLLAGGPETLVIPTVGAWGWWALTDAGVWFIERDRSTNTATLKFAAQSGAVQTSRTLPSVPPDSEHVLAADRAGRTVLLQQVDDRFGDLIMVEGFQ
jgi:Tol biopolymer transport system component/DNA-binding winged helix-turn-helix (wHTH) protein